MYLAYPGRCVLYYRHLLDKLYVIRSIPPNQNIHQRCSSYTLFSCLILFGQSFVFQGKVFLKVMSNFCQIFENLSFTFIDSLLFLTTQQNKERPLRLWLLFKWNIAVRIRSHFELSSLCTLLFMTKRSAWIERNVDLFALRVFQKCNEKHYSEYIAECKFFLSRLEPKFDVTYMNSIFKRNNLISLSDARNFGQTLFVQRSFTTINDCCFMALTMTELFFQFIQLFLLL